MYSLKASCNDITEFCILPSSVGYKVTTYSSASSSLEEPSINRQAIANRAFKTGEVVLRNAPLAYSLHGQFDGQRQRYCAYCFEKDEKLSRCGSCKSTWYCSRACQKNDFGLHKVECSYFSSPAFRSATMLQSDRIMAETALLIRTFVATYKNSQKQKGENSCSCMSTSDEIPIIECRADHLFALAKSSNSLDALDQHMIQHATDAIWSKRQALLKAGASENDNAQVTKEYICHQMETLLRVFHINNFGITDELLRVIASAVYPLGALLNHSCSPNCLLRYSLSSSSPPILEIVACRDIELGEELVHSYVELVQPLSVRQQNLHSNYGFTCCCSRCTLEIDMVDSSRKQVDDEIPVLLHIEEPPALRNWLDFFNPLLEDKTVMPELKSNDGINCLHPTNTPIRPIIDQYRHQARQCMAMDDLQGEIDCLSQTVNGLCQLLVLENQDEQKKTALEIYQVRGDLLGTLIVAGEMEKAIIECEYIVLFLVATLGDDYVNCQNHPILGLQLFTLGDLYHASANCEKKSYYNDLSQKTFEWAKKVLIISHGKDANMVKLLKEKMLVI